MGGHDAVDAVARNGDLGYLELCFVYILAIHNYISGIANVKLEPDYRNIHTEMR